MTIEQLEAEVLALPKDTLALLVTRLIEHLGQVKEIDQQVANEWIQESELRDEDMSNGKIVGIASQEVFSKYYLLVETGWENGDRIYGC